MKQLSFFPGLANLSLPSFEDCRVLLTVETDLAASDTLEGILVGWIRVFPCYLDPQYPLNLPFPPTKKCSLRIF